MAERDARRVGHVAGLVVEDLVARVERGPEQRIERLGDADRDKNLIFRIIFGAVVTGHVAGDFLAQG